MTALTYLIYFPFDNWTYLRFLLPCFPMLLVLAFVVVHMTVPASGRVGVTAALAVFLLAHHVTASQRLSVLNVKNTERRYEQMATIAGVLFEKSVFVSAQHSGSLRYYTGRPILRYDWVPAGELEQMLGLLRDRGYRPHLILDESEEPPFRERFGQENPTGRLDWPPVVELNTTPPVRLYDPLDRTRFKSGELLQTLRNAVADR